MKRLELEEQRREKGRTWQSKWDKFREEKWRYFDTASVLVKRRALVKRLIATMMIQKIIVHLCGNFAEWRARNLRKLNRMFLAIRFKFRFRNQFYQKFGKSFNQRNVN